MSSKPLVSRAPWLEPVVAKVITEPSADVDADGRKTSPFPDRLPSALPDRSVVVPGTRSRR
jgi:hypothetical protein